jgi:hypothetical protein
MYDSKRNNSKCLLKYVCFTVFSFLAFPAWGQSVTAKFTADNSFQVWTGTANQITTGPLLQSSNTESPQIFNATQVTFDWIPQCQIYLVAWSDDVVYQGLIGQFDYVDANGTVIESIYTGDASLKVLPAQNFGATNIGNEGTPGFQWPSMADLNGWMGAAQAGNWADPFVGGTNNPPANVWSSPVNGIDAQARWIWHESGTDPNTNSPFRGFDHGEPLIFRIPCPSPPPPPPPPCPCGDDTILQERAGSRLMWAITPEGQYSRHYWDGSQWKVETMEVNPAPRKLVGRSLHNNNWGWGVVAVDDLGFINITSYKDSDDEWINGRPIPNIVKRHGGFDPCSLVVTSQGIWGMTNSGHLLHLFPESGAWQWEQIDTKGNAESIVGCSIFEGFDGNIGGLLENGQIWGTWINNGSVEFDYNDSFKSMAPESCEQLEE